MHVTIVSISQIDPPDPILRQFSEKEVLFLELVDQIKYFGGPLQAPPARIRPNGRLQLVDGYRRYLATIEADIKTMPLNVIELMNDEDYLAAQLACNAMHKDVNWIDYAHHLERLRKLSGTEITMGELADKCKRSTAWVRKTLQLNHLGPRFKQMVQRNEVPIGNAYWLAKMPLSEQRQYFRDAQVMTTREFEKIARHALKEYREAVKAGKLDKLGADEFKPQMRDLQVIETEMKNPSHLPLMIASAGLTNPIEAAILALKWAFRIDDASIEERNEKMLSRERQRTNDAMRRKHDRDQKRNEEQS